MSWFFWWRLSARDKEDGLALIRHLQKMLAYQQLTMEGYNDAIAFAAQMPRFTNESQFPRLLAGVCDTSAVRDHVLPALRAKDRILQCMETEHRSVEKPKTDALSSAYNDFSRALRVMQDRTRLQFEVITAWLEDQSLATDTSHLDAAEQRAMSQAAASLNELIRKVGLDSDAWLDLNCDAFNAVRKTVGLSPMTADEFCAELGAVCLGGLAGRPARFFER